MERSGNYFNPFIGFDVIDLYEEAVKGLKSQGYTGIYVIYDEFSKYLETNITDASVSDTKMLQDFAEKCNRSGELQLHLMLISHKEIANYIDKLPKQKVDGWRGVSERFKHIHLNNNFTQTYEIVESAIYKKKGLWEKFCEEYKSSFEDIVIRYQKHNIFSELKNEIIERIIYGCYPLHPVSTFILPRLSERVAQNERTLFTFISAPGTSTLPAFLDKYNDDRFDLITPDIIYDYFDTHQHGDLMSRYTNDMDRISDALTDSLSDMLSSALTVVGIFCLMLVISPILTLVTLVTVPLMFWSARGIVRKSRQYFKAQQASLGSINGYIEEMM